MASPENVTLTSVINQQLEILDQQIHFLKRECGECIIQVERDLAAIGEGGVVNGRRWAEEQKSMQRRIGFSKEKWIECSGKDRALDRQIRLSSLSYRRMVSEQRIEDLTAWVICHYNRLKDSCLSMSQRSDGLLETIQNGLAEVSRKIDQIEKDWVKPSVGFFALKHSPLPAGDVTEFDCKDNYGRHLDTSSGRFTAPLNGFYLISTSTYSQSNTFCKICLHRMKYQPDQNPLALCKGYFNQSLTALWEAYSNQSPPALCNVNSNQSPKPLFGVYSNQSITLCVHMKEGDRVRLESATDVTTPDILIQFSCCLLQCGKTLAAPF
ncbi:unnamed protein product [Lymnaea stagnalis]|uniref:C1q domain-containing protein n=1 Tax=Lymnaea stagnalis TaxID=6523 RepID=A0AAV2I765_LYMST